MNEFNSVSILPAIVIYARFLSIVANLLIVLLDTKRKLNVRKTFKRRSGSFPGLCVYSIDLLWPGGYL